jgi:hypothetical protein
MLISNHRKLLSTKAMVVSVAETSGQDSGECKQTVADVSKAKLDQALRLLPR